MGPTVARTVRATYRLLPGADASPFFAGGTPNSKRPNSSCSGSRPVIQLLVENGGLATAKSKVFRLPLECRQCGLVSVLPLQISAEGSSCKNMFIRESAQVALSISCP